MSGHLRKQLGPAVARAKKLLPVDTAQFKTFPDSQKNAEDNLRILKLEKFNIQKNLAKIEPVRDKLTGLQNQWNEIINNTLDDGKRSNESAEYEKFVEKNNFDQTLNDLEETVIELQVKESEISHYIDELSSNTTSPNGSEQKPSLNIGVKLPPLPLVTYDGRSDWKAFEDCFREMVLENPSLSKTAKFRYLLSSLRGEAKSDIEPRFPASGDNFDAAWTTLQTKYGSNDAQQKILIVELLNLKQPKDEATDLASYIAQVESLCLRLEALNINTNTMETMVTIEKVLPERVRREVLKAKLRKDGEWTTSDLRRELKYIVKVEYELNLYNNTGKNQKVPEKTCNVTTKQSGHQKKKLVCVFCDGEHMNFKCSVFKSDEQRKNKLKQKKLCFNCLKDYHGRCTRSCKFCKKNGHCRLFCIEEKRNSSSTSHHNTSTSPTKSSSESQAHGLPQTNSQSHTAMVASSKTQEALLPSIMVKVFNPNTPDRCVHARALLDTAADASYITKKLSRVLELKTERSETSTATGFGGVQTTLETDEVNLGVMSLHNTFQFKCSAFTVDKISNQIRTATTTKHDGHVIPTSMEEVELLLGATTFAQICDLQRVSSGFSVLPTALGPAFMGTGRTAHNIFNVTRTNKNEVQDLWKLETIGILPSELNQDENDVKIRKNFEDNINYHDGRYWVKWLWKTPIPFVQSNRNLAESRLTSLYKKIKNTPILQKYSAVFDEQEKFQIIEEVDLAKPSDGIEHYLAHQSVVNWEKTSTPVRVVFDGSAGRASLNNALCTGPDLTPLMVGVLIRGRLHGHLMVADVEKAYLMIGLQKDQRDACRFLWLKDPSLPPSSNNTKVMRFCRVLFGASSSPSMLGMLLNYHIQKYASKELIDLLNRMIYVDNIIAGVKSAEDVVQKYKELKELFRKAGMNVRQFNSNIQEALQQLPIEDVEQKDKQGFLGMIWNVQEDTLELKPVKFKEFPLTTKTSITSGLHSIYDVIGIVAPAVLLGKLIVQEDWKNSKEWKTEVTPEVKERWQKFQQSWESAPVFSIPRNIPIASIYYVHCFADASKTAYGAVVYINGRITFAKSRLAPLKNALTIPRMELCATLVASRILTFIKKELNLKKSKVCLWTDSTATWSWCSQEDEPSDTFVRNRVKEIKDNLTHVNGRILHVPGTENPADVLSRGVSPAELKTNKLWWNGPSWMTKPETEWPKCDATIVKLKEDVPLSKQNVVVQSFMTIKDDIEESVKNTLTNATTWQEARNLLSECALNEKDKILLKANQAMSDNINSSLAKNLKLTLDEDNVLRCRFRALPTIQPVYIPKDGLLTPLLIKEVHENLAHAGVQHTLSALRSIGWIPQGRRQVEKVINQCNQCRKEKAKPFELPEMAPLPSSRTSRKHPFEEVGLDYAGPFVLKKPNQVAISDKDDDNNSKVWILLITCLTTRLCHLELVDGLSAEKFLNAFRIFVNRRMRPSLIVSDNMTAFHATKKAFPWFYDKEVQKYSEENLIQWKFICEHSPWSGGIYERMIGLMKSTIKRTVGKQRLNTEEWRVLLAEVEGILNTRPLTFVGKNPAHILRPLDLLTPGAVFGVPKIPNDDDPEDTDYIPQKKTRDKLVEYFRRTNSRLEKFWTIFESEYIDILREKSKWNHKEKGLLREPKMGERVWVRKEDTDKLDWPVAVITEIKRSSDGKVRNVEVTFSKGKLNRPISDIFPLEAECEDDGEESEDAIEDTVRETNMPQRTRRSPRLANILPTGTAMILLVMLLSIPIKAISPRHPLICPINSTKTYWKMPEAVKCPEIVIGNEEPLKAKYAIFQLNNKQYATKGMMCQKTLRTSETYTNLLGDELKKYDKTVNVKVSASECQEWIQKRYCSEGTLHQDGNLLYTENVMIHEYPTRWSSLIGKTSKNEVRNCYLTPVTITSHHKDKFIATIIGNTEHCPYVQGNCELKSGETLIWTPDKEEECDFLKVATSYGVIHGNLFVDEVEQIALTILDKTVKSKCHGMVNKTVQGLFVGKPKDTTRGLLGLSQTNVYSSMRELSPKLQFTAFDTVRQENNVFKTSFEMICKIVEEQGKMLANVAKHHPEDAFRELFNSSGISAKLVTPDVVEVVTCHELNANEYEIIKLKYCTELIPIKLTRKPTSPILFLDPLSMKTQKTSKKIDCHLQVTLVQLNGEIFQRTSDGTIVKVKMLDYHVEKSTLHLQDYSTALKAIHLSEIELAIPLSDFGEVRHQNEIVEIHDNDEISVKLAPSTMEMIADALFSIRIVCWRIYVTVVCACVSIISVWWVKVNMSEWLKGRNRRAPKETEEVEMKVQEVKTSSIDMAEVLKQITVNRKP